MSEMVTKCGVCGALLDEEDLFCANCGTEAPRAGAGLLEATAWTHNFECTGCGASMSYDASAQALRCPFCGGEHLEQRDDQKVLTPKSVVPFVIDQPTAVQHLRQWLKRGFFRPGNLSETAQVSNMTPVFVPFWVFEARVHTYWAADTSQTPPGARADWYPVSGEHSASYSGLLIGASSALTPQEANAICPYDLSQAVPAAQVDLENAIVEQFRVPRKYARPLAQQGLEAYESEACSRLVPGRNRNLNVNVMIEGLTSEPVLLPAWIMAYQYEQKVYRFLLNGQNARCTGEAPNSWLKITLLTGGIVLLALALFLLVAICAGRR